MTVSLHHLASLRPNMGVEELRFISNAAGCSLKVTNGEFELRGSFYVTLPSSEPASADKWICWGDLDLDRIAMDVRFSSKMKHVVMGIRCEMTLADALKEIPAAEVALSPEVQARGISGYRSLELQDGCWVRYSINEGIVVSIVLKAKDDEQRRAQVEQRIEEHRSARQRHAELVASWKTIGEPDQMLRTWARYHNSWGETDDRWSVLADWMLREATVFDRHILAQSWNWDYGIAPMLWMIRRQDTDLATAHVILQGTSPEYYEQYRGNRKDVPKFELEIYDFIAEISAKLNSGFFENSKIQYRPPKYYDRFKANLSANTLIPSSVFEELSGHPISSATHSYSVPVDIR